MTISDENHFRKIGAFAPSSTFLAAAMTKYVEEYAGAKRILEVGAGTGAITKSLIKRMSKDQHADIVEIYPKLSSLLSWRFGNYSSLSFYCTDIWNSCPIVSMT